MKNRKILTWLLATLCVGALSFGAACGESGATSGNNGGQAQPSEIQAVYAQYVAYAEGKGETPLLYEAWLASIKGEKGDQGVGIEKVEYDKDGNLVITLTDGSKQTVAMPEKEESGADSTQEGTPGLHYQRIAGKDEYRVIGLGIAAETDIVIPATYNGMPITEIGNNAFREESYITSIDIPDSITSIGSNAFSWCESLTEIVISNSVRNVGQGVFSGCSSLTIYCEAESKPSGWDSGWNPYWEFNDDGIMKCPVIWGYKGD